MLNRCFFFVLLTAVLEKNRTQAQAASYLVSTQLRLRPGSLYVNGKMLDLEGPTFNAFQVCLFVDACVAPGLQVKKAEQTRFVAV